MDDEPGIRRRGRRRPRYVDELSGEEVRDPDVLGRIAALAVPPAWTDVWISADICSHVQATGRDAKGRKQYRYHSRFREHQEEAKFELLVPFGRALPALRRRVDRDLRRRSLPRERVVAVVVELLERTLIRVGNEEYARSNGSFGLTTLRDRHVRIDGSQLRLRFTGKSAKLHEIAVDDPRLARLVRRCQELPGQVLFQYVDGDGMQHPVRSSREARSTVSAMLKVVSTELNNTPAVCRRSYIHPAVIDTYVAGGLEQRWASIPARGSPALTRDERKLLAFLSPR